MPGQALVASEVGVDVVAAVDPSGPICVRWGSNLGILWAKHFVGETGPTEIHPDPVAADGSRSTLSRPPPKKRRLQEISMEMPPDPMTMKMLHLQNSIEMKVLKLKKTKTKLEDGEIFGFDSVCRREGKLKDLFQYYTGLKLLRYLALVDFLAPSDDCIAYRKSRHDIKRLALKDCLFLCLYRLRHNFGLKDISMQFGLLLQSSSDIFNAWIEHIYFKFGQLIVWPHRDIIINNMPADYKKEFHTRMIITDGTEITQSPCALALQSQMYSDYKSSTALKCLIGCDPCVSLMFVSELFTGSVSDKEITTNSGFFDLLKALLQRGYLLEGDAGMADKGFTIGNELEKLGLKLNIPPFASSGSQMSPGDTELTQKIAKHRIHIERVISKIKNYRIVFHTIPTSLFQNINQIWAF
ncbi:uncharacterized protein LOC121369871 [Gigantopelta aegis]|uniref:uncharacterized protein LOC121369871 n=1 Tax=Gigantopelta aegis TaxID=1735272 RepID=UPI001B88805A|nr:uncharacterized protein LOC121369871 [Gigantopelta aegis]